MGGEARPPEKGDDLVCEVGLRGRKGVRGLARAKAIANVPVDHRATDGAELVESLSVGRARACIVLNSSPGTGTPPGYPIFPRLHRVRASTASARSPVFEHLFDQGARVGYRRAVTG